jgi:glycosyltransferase involved in cell wall biosynthesis
MPPAISVLLPVRDGEPFLAEALESLERQSWRDFEVVAVDDGSTDGTPGILSDWCADDPDRRVLTTGGIGLIGALNLGLADCRGRWVARMDADDRSHPRRLERQIALVGADRTIDVVSCRVRHFPDESVAVGFRIYEEWLNGLVRHEQIVRERFIESPIPHPTAMVRRSLFAAVGGYRDRGWPEDYDLWLRLAARGARFAKVPEILYDWRDRPDRLTRADRRYAVERFLECKAHHLVRGPLAGVDRVLLWGAGQTGRRLSKHLLRGGAPLVGFLDIDPAKIGGTRRGLPIHDADDLPTLLAAAPGSVVLAAVSSRGARALIRERLTTLRLAEGRNFWCVA